MKIAGKVEKVAGPIVTVKTDIDFEMNELVYVGENHLAGTVVKLYPHKAVLQVYEDTTMLCPDDDCYSTGAPLSVELGPGLIGEIYDGIARPLNELYKKNGSFLGKGIIADTLSRKVKWDFKSEVEVGEVLYEGSVLGTVMEKSIKHKITVPPFLSRQFVNNEWTVKKIAKNGSYKVDDVIAVLKNSETGEEKEMFMFQKWPVKTPRPSKKRLPLNKPLLTGLRVIDTMFPIAKGGAVCIPGGFGTGKTMTQHAIASYCDADIIVYIGCGERGNEMTDVLEGFSKLLDPRNNRPLLERTIMIANTSNMPVPAREASIYTGITMAEYYRDMGYNVAIMADSTSRWAEALRELSGRMEELPAEEGFPPYLATRLAEFYERAGMVKTLSGEEGSVSVIGAVSPAGGDFSEPVTQNTKRFTKGFWGLSRNLASQRHYPAIDWNESYSEYLNGISSYWNDLYSQWLDCRSTLQSILTQEARLEKTVKLVGPDALSDIQNFVLDVAKVIRIGFLQQSSFDKFDAYCPPEKQIALLDIIKSFYEKGIKALKAGVSLADLRKLENVSLIIRMKSLLWNKDEFDTKKRNILSGIDTLIEGVQKHE